jgi:rubrerythrin
MSMEDLKKIIEARIKNEQEAARSLQDSTRKTDNTVIRLLLYELALDSAKHEHMLKAILSLLDSPSSLPSRRESEEFHKIIEQHVEIEHEMLTSFEKIVDLAKDKRVRFILQDIISDEKKHHAIIKRVHQLISEGDKVKDEKWWDFLYRYSRLTS